MMIFQFKIQLKNITKPPVWRRVKVPCNFTFFDFHIVIQIAMGWYNEHLFQFSPGGYASNPQIKMVVDDDLDEGGFFEREILDAEKIKLSDVFIREKQKYMYIYDFGDNWIHTITLEKVIDTTIMFPQVISGKGQCPPEDSGGPWGYEQMKAILEDPKDEEYDSYREWLGLEAGDKWDSSFFDLKIKQKVMLNVFSE